MATDLKRLLMHLGETTTSEDLKATLDAVAAQCEQDYTAAEQINIKDKSELIATVANAKAAFAAMLQAVAEREATQGFWRKWGAANRATRACIAMRSAQALVRIALRKAEDETITGMGADPRDPLLGFLHLHSEAETYLL
jgi:hypothetical protein